MPATDVEALKSTLMGLFEKRRARKFFIYVQDYEDDDPKSHEGLDLNKVTTRDVISYAFNLLPFLLALYQSRVYARTCQIHIYCSLDLSIYSLSCLFT